MENLKTNFLSLTLKKPLVPLASSLSKNLNTAKKHEDAGALAIVLHSLFEDRIEQVQQLYLVNLLSKAVKDVADSVRK